MNPLLDQILEKHLKDTLQTRKVEHMDISRLKKTNSIDDLTKEMEKFTVTRQADDRFWKPDVDKTGNGAFIIRFLPKPAIDGDDARTLVRVYQHAFKGPTQQWYIENSRTTLGKSEKDPCGEYNSKLWAAGAYDEKNSPERKQASVQKRKTQYISNILVVSDPKHPENEGKNFLFKYGPKIYDKIKASMHPEFEGDARVDPFNFWNGANFRMKINNVKGGDGKFYRSYDASVFEAPAPVFSGGEDAPEFDTLWKKEYSLLDFLKPENFKSYGELKTRLDQVMGFDTGAYNNTTSQQRPLKVTSGSAVAIETEDDYVVVEDSEDDDLQHFRNLAS
jgi:hypothetical protein